MTVHWTFKEDIAFDKEDGCIVSLLNSLTFDGTVHQSREYPVRFTPHEVLENYDKLIFKAPVFDMFSEPDGRPKHIEKFIKNLVPAGVSVENQHAVTACILSLMIKMQHYIKCALILNPNSNTDGAVDVILMCQKALDKLLFVIRDEWLADLSNDYYGIVKSLENDRVLIETYNGNNFSVAKDTLAESDLLKGGERIRLYKTKVTSDIVEMLKRASGLGDPLKNFKKWSFFII